MPLQVWGHSLGSFVAESSLPGYSVMLLQVMNTAYDTQVVVHSHHKMIALTEGLPTSGHQQVV